jgi:hypothetical protein
MRARAAEAAASFPRMHRGRRRPSDPTEGLAAVTRSGPRELGDLGANILSGNGISERHLSRPAPADYTLVLLMALAEAAIQ